MSHWNAGVGNGPGLMRRLADLTDLGEVELASFTSAELASVGVPSRLDLHRTESGGPSEPPGRGTGNDEARRSLVDRGLVEIRRDDSGAEATDDASGRSSAYLMGDLAIVVSLRTNPSWIAEVTRVALQDRGSAHSWCLYGGANPPAVLEETVAGEERRFWLRRPDRAMEALLAQVGLDPVTGGSTMSGRTDSEPGGVTAASVSEVLKACAHLVRVQVAQGGEAEVLVRGTAVAWGPPHWLIEGTDQGQKARRATPGDVSRCLTQLLHLDH